MAATAMMAAAADDSWRQVLHKGWGEEKVQPV